MENKIVEINNSKYSQKTFDEYKNRYKFEFIFKGELKKTYVDIYSDCASNDKVFLDIQNHLEKKCEVLSISHVASKEEDSFIDNLLN